MHLQRLSPAAAAALLSLAGLLFGCDKDAAPPVTLPAPAPAKTLTIQDILAGPRNTIPLGGLPFTIAVPSQWAVHNNGLPGGPIVSMLEGPLIGGDAHIILRQRDDQSPLRMKALIDHVRRDAPAIEQSGGILKIRDDGDIRIIDRRSGRPATAPAASLNDTATQPFDAPIEWRITFFVPAGVNYEQYELQFIDLTPAVLAQNEKVLSDIVGSLKFSDPGRPPT